MKTRHVIFWSIVVFTMLISSRAHAFLDMFGGAGEYAGIMALAAAVQKAFESSQYAFIAVIGLMLSIQLVKALTARRSDHMKRNAHRYAAGGGALMGGAMSQYTGSDPVAGAVGGMMVGNAASGLYSTVVKPLGKLVRGR